MIYKWFAERVGSYGRALSLGSVGGEFFDLAARLDHSLVGLGQGHTQLTYRLIDNLETACELVVRADQDTRGRRQAPFNFLRLQPGANVGIRERIEAHMFSGLPFRASEIGDVQRYFPVCSKAVSIPRLELPPGEVLDLSTYADEWTVHRDRDIFVVANIGACILHSGARIQVRGNLLSFLIQNLTVPGPGDGGGRADRDGHHFAILPGSVRRIRPAAGGADQDQPRGGARIAEITIRRITRNSGPVIFLSRAGDGVESASEDAGDHLDADVTVRTNVFINCPRRYQSKIDVVSIDALEPGPAVPDRVQNTGARGHPPTNDPYGTTQPSGDDSQVSPGTASGRRSPPKRRRWVRTAVYVNETLRRDRAGGAGSVQAVEAGA